MNVMNNTGNFRHRRNFKKSGGSSNHRNDFRRSNNGGNGGNGGNSHQARHPELDIVIDGRAVKKASMMRDKYQALARDAQSAGDRVQAENCLQHADHYNRILNAANELRPQQAPRNNNADTDTDDFSDTDAQASDNAGNEGNTAPVEADADRMEATAEDKTEEEIVAA